MAASEEHTGYSRRDLHPAYYHCRIRLTMSRGRKSRVQEGAAPVGIVSHNEADTCRLYVEPKLKTARLAVLSAPPCEW